MYIYPELLVQVPQNYDCHAMFQNCSRFNIKICLFIDTSYNGSSSVSGTPAPDAMYCTAVRAFMRYASFAVGKVAPVRWRDGY